MFQYFDAICLAPKTASSLQKRFDPLEENAFLWMICHPEFNENQ